MEALASGFVAANSDYQPSVLPLIDEGDVVIVAGFEGLLERQQRIEMGQFTIVILDFETSGLSPDFGDRPIEIGAILLQDNKPVDKFQSLMNPGFEISSFIEDYTGISNRMLVKAPACSDVMRKFSSFIEGHHLAAHNAAFDSKFLDAELGRLSLRRNNDIVCTMLAARRLYRQAPNHKLETLSRHLEINSSGQFHRALSDAEVTASLWQKMVWDIKKQYGVKSISFNLMYRLTKVPIAKAANYIKRHAVTECIGRKRSCNKKSKGRKKSVSVDEKFYALFPNMPSEDRKWAMAHFIRKRCQGRKSVDNLETNIIAGVEEYIRKHYAKSYLYELRSARGSGHDCSGYEIEGRIERLLAGWRGKGMVE